VKEYKDQHQLQVEEMPEDSRAQVAGRLMRAAVEEAAVAAPEAVPASAPEAAQAPEPAPPATSPSSSSGGG
jgi:hypothetical protein